MKIGDRVKVKPLDIERWATGAPAVLTGVTGVIEAARELRSLEDMEMPDRRCFLVAFDKVIPRSKTTWPHTMPSRGMWFNAAEIEPEGETT